MNEFLRISRAEKSRWILLAMLVPLLAFAVVESARYDDKPIMQIALSRNSKQLYVFRGEYDYRTFPNQEIYEEVQIWDLASHRLVATKKTQSGRIFPSSNGECFFQLSKDGKLRILEPGSFESRVELTLPTVQGEILTLEGDSRLLIIESVARARKKQYLTVIDLSGNQPSIVRSEADSAGFLTASGRRLLVSHHDTATDSWTNESLIVEQGKLIPAGDSFPGLPMAASDDGNIIYTAEGPARAFHDLGNGSVTPWTLPSSVPIGVSFAADGRVLRVLDITGTMSVVDTSTGDEVRTIELEQPNPRLWITPWGSTFPLDGNRVTAVNDRTVWLWDTATGKGIARFPNHRIARWTLSALYVVWCLLWVGFGIKTRRPRPWLDVLLIHIPLVVLIIHAATRPVGSIHRALIAVSIGLLTSLLGMLIVWWIHGRLRWSLRLTGMVAGGAVVAGLLLASGHGNDLGVWNVMLGSASYVLMLAFFLKVPRWLGIGIRQKSDTSLSEDTRWQMPLKDILLMTTAIALLFTIARFAEPGSRPLKTVIYLALHGSLLAAIVFICTTVAFLPKRLVLVFPIVPITAAIFGAIPVWCFGRNFIDPLWWCEILYAVTATAFFCSMLVFRLHGYRWVRLHHDRTANKDEKEFMDERQEFSIGR